MKDKAHWLAMIGQGVDSPDEMGDIIEMIQVDALRWVDEQLRLRAAIERAANARPQECILLAAAESFADKADAIERGPKQEGKAHE